MAERRLVHIELRFISADDPEQVGERIRDAVRMIVGREELEDFRLRTLPLMKKERPGARD